MSSTAEIYQEVTDRIIAALERGTPPWVKPWATVGTGSIMPSNASTGKRYNGVNMLLLFVAADHFNFGDPRWVTFKQAKALGGSVVKGSKGTRILFFRFLYLDGDGNRIPEADAIERIKRGERLQKIPQPRVYTVFNVGQCEGLEIPKPVKVTPIGDAADDDDRSGGFVAAMERDGVTFVTGGDSAHYTPALDRITTPPIERFRSVADYHATKTHEIVHATGHASRLARDFSGRFGSDSYAFEELIAEMGSAYLCAHAGIDGQLQHAAYLAGWLKVLRSDNRAIFTAARAAQTAADYVIDRL